MKIIVFGQLTDITGSDTIVVEAVADTDGLIKALHLLYPAMAGVKYVMAVDKR